MERFGTANLLLIHKLLATTILASVPQLAHAACTDTTRAGGVIDRTCDDEDDEFRIEEDAVVEYGIVNLGGGLDTAEIADGVVDQLDTGLGDDAVSIRGGVIRSVDLGRGFDTVRLEQGTLSGSLSGGDDGDIVEIQGGELADAIVSLEDGDDALLMSGGAVTGETSIDMGTGGDIVTLSGGDIRTTPAAQSPYYAYFTNADDLFLGRSIRLGEGDDSFVAVDGNHLVGVDGGAGDDRLTFGATTFGGFDGENNNVVIMDGGSGADTFEVDAGIIHGSLRGGEGNDTYRITGGEIYTYKFDNGGLFLEAIDAGDGDDLLQISNAALDEVVLGAGDDRVEISGDLRSTFVEGGRGLDGDNTGFIFGDDGNDSFALTGGTIGNYDDFEYFILEGNDGDDDFVIDGAVLVGDLVGGPGNDTFRISSGGILEDGGVLFADDSDDTGEGDDAVVIDGTGYVGNIYLGEGADTLLIEDTGGTDRVRLGAGDDVVTVRSTGTFAPSLIDLSAGDDRFTLESGLLDGLATLGGNRGWVRGYSGNDTFEMLGGEVRGYLVRTGDGDDQFRLVDGAITGDTMLYMGGGADLLEITGGTIQLDPEEVDSTGVARAGTVFFDNDGGTIGDDRLVITAGSHDASFSMEFGDDSVYLGETTLGGSDVSVVIDGDRGEDLFEVDGAVVYGSLIGGEDNDTYRITGGELRPVAFDGDSTSQFAIHDFLGEDLVQISGGIVDAIYLGRVLAISGETDRLELSGGALIGDVTAGSGDDSFLLTGGTVGATDDPVSLLGGRGDDDFVVDGATVFGTLDGGRGVDSVRISSGSVESVVLGGWDDSVEWTGGAVSSIDFGDDDDSAIISATNAAPATDLLLGDGDDTAFFSGVPANETLVDGGDGFDTVTFSNAGPVRFADDAVRTVALEEVFGVASSAILGGTVDTQRLDLDTDSILSGTGTVVGRVEMAGVADLGAADAPIGRLDAGSDVVFADGALYRVTHTAEDVAGAVVERNDFIESGGRLRFETGSDIAFDSRNLEVIALGSEYHIGHGADAVETQAAISDNVVLFDFLSEVRDAPGGGEDLYLYTVRASAGPGTGASISSLVEGQQATETGNALAAAGALDAMIDEGASNSLVTAFGTLTTTQGVVGLVEEVRPDESRQLTGALSSMSDMLNGFVHDRARLTFDDDRLAAGNGYGPLHRSLDPEGTISPWIKAYGFTADFDGSGSSSGFEAHGGGLLFGADMVLERGALLGVAFNGFRQSSEAGASSIDADGMGLSVYAAREFGRTLLEGAVGFGKLDGETKRSISGLGEVARGEFDARYASLFLRGSTEIERDGYLIRPEAAFELLVVNRDNYTEDGSSAAMSYDGDTSTLATVRLGATVARRFELGSSEGAVELLGRINYREALDDERFKTSYVAGGDRFSTRWSDALEGLSPELGIRIGLETESSLKLTAGYRIEFKGSSRIQSASIGARWEF